MPFADNPIMHSSDICLLRPSSNAGVFSESGQLWGVCSLSVLVQKFPVRCRVQGVGATVY